MKKLFIGLTAISFLFSFSAFAYGEKDCSINIAGIGLTEGQISKLSKKYSPTVEEARFHLMLQGQCSDGDCFFHVTVYDADGSVFSAAGAESSWFGHPAITAVKRAFKKLDSCL